MIESPRRRNRPFVMSLALVVAAATSAATDGFALAQEEPTLRELATASRAKAASSRDAALRKIVSGLKGDRLEVVLTGSRGMYVNGTSIGLDALATIISESGLEQAAVKADPTVSQERVAQVEGAIKKAGAEDVEVDAPRPTLRELATAARAKAARKRTATLRQMASRQKGDRLKVYLRDASRVYVNGKQISLGVLSTFAGESGLEQAIITAEPFVSPERVTEVEDVITKAGIEDVERTIRK